MHIIRNILVLLFLCSMGLISAHAQNPVSFSVSVSPSGVPAGGTGTARIAVSIDGGWYIYSLTQGPGGPVATQVTLGEGPFKMGGIRGTAPKTKMDPNFGIKTETHSGGATFTFPFTVAPETPEGPQSLNVRVRYQACNDSVCLPPKTVKLAAALTIAAARAAPAASPTPTPSPKSKENTNIGAEAVTTLSTANNAVANESVPAAKPQVSASPASAIDEAIPRSTQATRNRSLWGFIWLAMTFGALSLLTPCVFPMIPITVSYFTKNAADSHLGSIRDALVYALGIILTFTALGIALALLFGAAGLNQFAANPWVNLLIMGIFLFFAFSLIGAFNIGIPPAVLNRLDGLTRSKESSKILGLLLMGLTFSLTSFTCTAPLVGTILVAAAGGELLYPIVGMLAFSSVFALPFFVLAVAPRLLHSLPKSGGWMNALKVVMGFLEIGAALKFLSNADLVWQWGIFTREVVIAGWIGLSILIFLYLLGLFRLDHDFGEVRVGLVRVLNAFLFITLAFYLLTGLMGAKLGEIESFLPPATAAASAGKFGASDEPTWITNDYKLAIDRAKADNKRVFIDFTGYTCTNCRWMEVNMFPKPSVRAGLEKFILLRLYTDGEGEPYEGFQKMQEERFGTVALPLYAIVSPEEAVIAKFEGLTRDESEFARFLTQAAQ